MDYNIVTIDPSLNSTAMVVNGKIFNYIKEDLALTKKREHKKWFKLCEDLVEYYYIPEEKKIKDYSKLEVNKILSYSKTTNKIFEDIKANIDQMKQTIVVIEGYSYSSASGPLIDLVTFSTLLRIALVNTFLEVIVMSPSTVKAESAKLTYPPIKKGVKVIKYEWRNFEGTAGGSFKKHEMYKALTDNPNLSGDWIDLLNDNMDAIMDAKSVPKPIEDINDSLLVYEIIKNKINNNIPLDF